MAQINCIGQIFGTDGYSNHTRNLINALNGFADIRLTTNFIPDWEKVISDKELEMVKRKEDKDEINLIVTNPNNWKLNCTKKRNWVYLIWEGDRIPKSFIEECLNPDIEYILVASNHTKNAV